MQFIALVIAHESSTSEFFIRKPPNNPYSLEYFSTFSKIFPTFHFSSSNFYLSGADSQTFEIYKKKKKKKGRSRDQKRNTKYEGALENKFNVKIFGVKFVHESTWNYTKARSMKRR